MAVLEESSLGLPFSKKFLADLKISLGLLSSKCFAESFKVFFHTQVLLILAQNFAPFDCLPFPWRNLSCKFSIIVLNSSLKFSCKVLNLYLSQEILILSCKVLFLEKDF